MNDEQPRRNGPINIDKFMLDGATLGRNQAERSLRPPCLQAFNTKRTEHLRDLRVEAVVVKEDTEPQGT